LKRTRRIEIVRYSRRSKLVISDETAFEADLATEAAINVLFDISSTELPIEQIGEFAKPGVEANLTGAIEPYTSRMCRPLKLLKRWIRG